MKSFLFTYHIAATGLRRRFSEVVGQLTFESQESTKCAKEKSRMASELTIHCEVSCLMLTSNVLNNQQSRSLSTYEE